MPKCLKCAKDGTHKCGRCKDAYYCSRECQTSDWDEHKKKCGKPDVLIEEIALAGSTFFSHFHHQLRFPVKITAIKHHKGKIYYYHHIYKERVPDRWEEDLEEKIIKEVGKAALKQYLIANTCEYVGSIRDKLNDWLAEGRTVRIRGETVRSVYLMGVKVYDNYTNPIVNCYCDPKTPPERIHPADLDDFYARAEHKVLEVITTANSYVIDLSHEQYKFNCSLVTPMVEYLSFAQPRSRFIANSELVFNPAIGNESDHNRTLRILRSGKKGIYDYLAEMEMCVKMGISAQEFCKRKISQCPTCSRLKVHSLLEGNVFVYLVFNNPGNTWRIKKFSATTTQEVQILCNTSM